MIKSILNYLLAGMYKEAERLIEHLLPPEIIELCEMIDQYRGLKDTVIDNTHARIWAKAIGGK